MLVVSNQQEPVVLTRAEAIQLIVALHQARLDLEATDRLVNAAVLATMADFIEDRLYGGGTRPNT